jgi:hypothetical protein
MVAGFPYPNSDGDTKSNRLAELEFSPISIAFRRHQWRLRTFVLVQQPPLVQESAEMSLENLTLRSIWACPVLLKDELP